MKGSIRLGTIRGIEIGVHYSWLFIFLLVAWSLAQGYFPQMSPGRNGLTYWVVGSVASLLLFVSVLLHELAHSFVAQARGLPVRSITLFIFGGVSNIAREPEKAETEFVMAVVGPLTSIVLTIISWGLLQVFSPNFVPLTDVFRSGLFIGSSNMSLSASTVHYLVYINGLLAAFNLLPGFPLDGGRVLRSILWGATNNIVKATNIASRVGQLFGWGFVAVGVYYIFSGAFLNGIWIAVIGWFLNNAAEASRQEVSLQALMKGVKVKDVMTPNPSTISPGATVAEVVQGIFRQQHGRAVPVVQEGKLVGLVTVTNIRELPQEKWATTPAEAIMTRSPLRCVSPDDDLSKAMQMIAEFDVNQVMVCGEGPRLIGILSRADIIRHLQFAQELGMRRKD